MARALRIEYPGAVYHVMAHGGQGQAIFHHDGDRRSFLKTLGEASFGKELAVNLDKA